MTYAAPLKDMLFVIRHLAGLDTVRQLPGFAEATDDTVEAVLEEAAQLQRRGGRSAQPKRRHHAVDRLERQGDHLAGVP